MSQKIMPFGISLKILNKGKNRGFFSSFIFKSVAPISNKTSGHFRSDVLNCRRRPHKKLSELFFISKMRIIFTSFTSKNERSSMDKLVWHIFLRQHLKRI
jgi:hypothetical protein